MGVVYRVYDRLARREVAYKRLLSEGKTSKAKRIALFEQEYNALAQLSHPNIVQVYEYGFDAAGPFYTMELLSGSDLYARAPLPIQQACSVLRDVASALSLVHARRLVHRDISPLNVRLTEDGRAKLIDFGALARVGRANEVVGTPAFVAPECLSTHELDARTDLFSLGALAYWLLTRKSAFPVRSLDERKALLDHQPDPPSAYVPGVPPELDELVLGLLHVDPMARPGSAAEVMERLTVIAGLPEEPNERQVAASYLAHPPLVGRARELAIVRDRLAECLVGSMRTLCVTGQQGMGRTALLEQLAIEAQLTGATTLRAQGGHDVAPFAVAHSLLRAAMVPVAAQAEPARSYGVEHPGVRMNPTNATTVAAVERHAQRVDALVASFLEVCREQPLVVLIDDAHRVDVESLAVLASLAAAAAASDKPLLIVLSLPEGAAEKAHGALGKLVARAQNISIGALSPEHLLELVTSVFGAVPNARRLSLWLTEHTAGNPAACVEQLRLLLHDGVIQYATGTFVLPHDIDADVVARSRRGVQLALLPLLSDNALLLARILALQSVGMDIELLASVADIEGRAALEAYDELRARGVVVSRGSEIRLAHDTLRQVLLEGLDADAQRALHLKVARALAPRQGDLVTPFMIAENLLHGGAEEEAALIFTQLASEDNLDVVDGAVVEVLETALSAMRRRGFNDEQCMPILLPLVRAGFFGIYAAQERHWNRSVDTLMRSTGLSVARKLRPILGPTLALILGIVYALLRRAFTPRRKLFGTWRDTLAALLTMVGSGVAAAASAFDPALIRDMLDRVSPLAWFAKGSAPRMVYDFACAAWCGSTGRSEEASARYREVRELLQADKVAGLADKVRDIYILACTYGEAQSELSNGTARVLQLADELELGDTFYFTHASTTRMAYYAYRGEHELAAEHRERAELAALRGGCSWSAVTLVTVRLLYGYIWTRDAIGLVRLIPEFERLAQVSPNLGLYRELARGYLAFLRGDPEKAVEHYRRVLSDARHPLLATRLLDRIQYAEILRAVGCHEAAKRECEQVLADPERLGPRRYLARQQWALCVAERGDLSAALQELEACVDELGDTDNPLLWGSLHRDWAQVALIAGDARAFCDHLRAMSRHFRRTRNPCLIRQTEQLLQRGRQKGLAGLQEFAGESVPLSSGTYGDVEPVGASEAHTVLERGYTSPGHSPFDRATEIELPVPTTAESAPAR